MRSSGFFGVLARLWILSLLSACGDDAASDGAVDSAPDAPVPCEETFSFEAGDDTGHGDPLGATAGEARAGRLAADAWPPDPEELSFVRDGDFVLANEHIAVVIEDAGASDLLDPWGGRPIGAARMVEGAPFEPASFAEMMLMLGRYTLATETVGVLNDGSDGTAAIVRAVGPISEMPFFAPLAGAFLTADYDDWIAAFDWILEPGAGHVDLVITIASTRLYEMPVLSPLYFFFQSQRMPEWHPNGTGFAGGGDPIDYVAFADDDATSYAWASHEGRISPAIMLSGASIFSPDTFRVAACAETTVPFGRLHVGGRGIDGLRAAIARTEEAPLRRVTGSVSFADGSPAAGVRVHATAADGDHVTRALSDEAGAFTLHLPAEPVELTAWLRGYDVPVPVAVSADAASTSLMLPAAGTLRVSVVDAADDTPIPARIQVVPNGELPMVPEGFGEPAIMDGRLHVVSSIDGTAEVPAPPGDYTVHVSRGFEWELGTESVTVVADGTTELSVRLEHVVHTPGVLCGDTHIHTHRSFDTSDPVTDKVRAIIADGIEVPVRSDHEWVGDFEPMIAELGVEDYAYGISSLELTTFDWGHFGVFPIDADASMPSAGAIPWTGRTPGEAFADVHGRVGSAGVPIVIVNHARSFGGLMGEGAYFQRVGYDPLTGMVERPELWSEAFNAIEVFNESDFDQNVGEVVDDWFSFLNTGRRIFATGASDSHQVADQPVGYPRTCFDVGYDDAPSLRSGGGAASVRDSLTIGHAVISGGAYIDVEGPGGEGPGDEVSGAGERATVRVTVRAPSFVQLDRLRIFVDGAVTETITLDESTMDPMDATVRFAGDIDVPVAAGAMGSWAIIVADGRSFDLSPVYPGRHPFGATNPMFFTR